MLKFDEEITKAKMLKYMIIKILFMWILAT